MLSNQFSRLRHKRLTRRYRMTSLRFFFVFAHLNSMLIPSRRFSQQPANTCPSLYLRLSASQVHSAFFLRETVGGNNRAFMSHRETFVADLRRNFFSMTLLFREQQSRWTLSSSASREHVPTCLKWPPLAHLYQTGLLHQTCSFFLSIVASQSTDFAFVSCRVHWVPTV